MKRFKPVKHRYTNEVYMQESDEGLYVLFQGASDLELVLRQRIEELEEWIAGISDDHPDIPDWIQGSARHLLAQRSIANTRRNHAALARYNSKKFMRVSHE